MATGATPSSPIDLQTPPDVASPVDSLSSTDNMTIEEKRRLNSRAPISRLPPEVLSLVFTNLRHVHVQSWNEIFPASLEGLGSEIWLDITHVCHDWREIALATPSLWSRIISVPGNNNWTREMLRRSRRSTLTCVIEGPSKWRSDLVHQLGRCNTLSLYNVPFEDLKIYWSSRLDAPHLERLQIYNKYRGPFTTESSFTLSDSLLLAPSLRCLELENCGIDWQSGFMNRLTHLGLECLPADSQLECSYLIKVLANIPMLEGIYLAHPYIRNEATDTPLFSDTIPTDYYWHHLQLLSIVDDVCNIALFLSHIILLPLTKVHLRTLDSLDDAEPHLPLLLNWISKHFNQFVHEADFWWPPPNIIRSFVLREADDEFTMQGFNEVLSVEDEALQCNASLVFSLLLEDEHLDTVRETIEQIFLPLLPIGAIVFLDVSITNFHLSTPCWSAIFGTIPTLEAIRISLGYMFFFDALLPSPNNPHFLPFRALKSVSLFGYVPPINYHYMIRILHDRVKLGKRLAEFVLSSYNILPTYFDLSQLMEAVSSVGIHRPLRDDSDSCSELSIPLT